MSDPLSTPAQTAQDTGPLAPLQPVTQTRSDRSYSVSATATFPAADYSRAPSIQLNASSLVNPAAAADNSGTDPFDLSDELGGEDDEDDTASRRTGRSTGRSTPTTRSSIPTPPPSRMSSIAPSPRTHTPVTTQHFQMSSSSSPRSHSRVPSPVRAAQSMRHHPSSNNTRSAPGSRSISPSQGGATGEHPLEWKRSPTLPVLAPTLIQPGMFVALPQTDALAPLVARLLPPEERRPSTPIPSLSSSSGGVTAADLIAAGRWRALALLARDGVVRAHPGDLRGILELYHLRHLALDALRLVVHSAHELRLLSRALSHLSPHVRSAIFPSPSSEETEEVLPFGLELQLARAEGGIDGVAALVRRCRLRARRAASDAGRDKWRERARRVGVVLAGMLFDAGDSVAAQTLLAPLLSCSSSPSSSALDAVTLATAHRLALATGDLALAQSLLSRLSASVDNSSQPQRELVHGERNLFRFAVGEVVAPSPVQLTSEGGGDQAAVTVAEDTSKIGGEEEEGRKIVRANAKAVALVYGGGGRDGKLEEAIKTLEELLPPIPSSSSSNAGVPPSAASAAAAALSEPILFNLATLYELRHGPAEAHARKIALLRRIIVLGAGEGLRPACLKLA